MGIVFASSSNPRAQQHREALKTPGFSLSMIRFEIANFYTHIADALELSFAVAQSVDDALEIIDDRGMPGLLITDIELGEKTGIELISELRKRPDGGLPVIVVSGHTGEGIAEQVTKVGAMKHLVKPVSRKRLFDEISAVLDC